MRVVRRLTQDASRLIVDEQIRMAAGGRDVRQLDHTCTAGLLNRDCHGYRQVTSET